MRMMTLVQTSGTMRRWSGNTSPAQSRSLLDSIVLVIIIAASRSNPKTKQVRYQEDGAPLVSRSRLMAPGGGRTGWMMARTARAGWLSCPGPPEDEEERASLDPIFLLHHQPFLRSHHGHDATQSQLGQPSSRCRHIALNGHKGHRQAS